jgi:hypothetical protein
MTPAMKLVQRTLHLFGAHWWTPALTSDRHWCCRWCGAMALRLRPCVVHYPNGALRHIDYRYVRHTICTCHPVPVVKVPPTEPATPPVRRRDG